MEKIDYQKEFFNLLANNDIRVLPSKEIINSDSEVALLVWKNYYPDGYGDEYHTPEPTKWHMVLYAYKNNQEFWEKAFASNNSYHHLLDKSFQDFFTPITDFWLNSNKMLLLAFEKTGDTRFNDLITDEKHKKDSYKTFLLSNTYKAGPDDIARYEDDFDFTVKMIEAQPYYYKYLSLENKSKPEFIQMAIIKKELFGDIPEELQPQFRRQWFERHFKNFNAKDIDEMSVDEQKEVFSYNPSFLRNMFNRSPMKYSALAEEMIQKSPKTFFNTFGVDEFSSSLSKKFLNSPRFINYLKNFVDNYSSDDIKNNADKKLFAFIENNQLFKEELKENFYYQIRQKKLNKKRFNQAQYDKMLDIVLKENDNAVARKMLGLVRSVTEIEVLKTLPKAKDQLLYYRAQKLEETLASDEKTTLKVKI